jgi:hypothetical protein
MGVTKLVDSTQLDTDLTSVANAIRTKGGTSAQLAFPSGFVSAVGNLPAPTGTKQIYISENGTTTEDVEDYANAEITVNVSGGGGGGDQTTEAKIIMQTLSGTYENTLVTVVGAGALRYNSGLTGISLPNCTQLKDSALRQCTGITAINFPKASNVGRGGQNYVFAGCTSLVTAVLPAIEQTGSLPLGFNGDTALKTVDLGDHSGGITNQAFAGCTSFDTLILRSSSSVWELGNTNVFNNTPFASGGTGGTIYIPKALYDHLGDGTSYDYKAATNWSTINGYGTITWAKIEGSQYENYYADGTTISS